jgi:hypothetical protein
MVSICGDVFKVNGNREDCEDFRPDERKRPAGGRPYPSENYWRSPTAFSDSGHTGELTSTRNTIPPLRGGTKGGVPALVRFRAREDACLGGKDSGAGEDACRRESSSSFILHPSSFILHPSSLPIPAGSQTTARRRQDSRQLLPLGADSCPFCLPFSTFHLPPLCGGRPGWGWGKGRG